MPTLMMAGLAITLFGATLSWLPYHGVPEHQVFDRVSWKDRNLTSFDPYGASPDFMSYVTRLLSRAGYARPGFVGFSESAHPS